LARSISSIDSHQRLPSFQSVRQIASQARIAQERAAGASDRDLLELALAEIDELKRTLEEERSEFGELVRVAEREREEAIEETEQLRARVSNLRFRNESLQKLDGPSVASPQVPIPADLAGFQDWCREHLPGSVEVLHRAFRGVKESVFHDPSLLYRALLLLRDSYVPMRREGGDNLARAFRDGCAELGLKEELTFAGPRWGEEGDTYIVSYQGKRRLLDRHLKAGNSREPRYCFRLYFFWDEIDQQAVVGWLPSHLGNRAS
jgi:hypothetical protein